MLVPRPNIMDFNRGYFQLSPTLWIQSHPSTKHLIQFLSEEYSITCVQSSNSNKYDIDILVEAKVSSKLGSYTLEVKEKQITIRAKEDEGVFYGVQTLIQMMIANGGKIPCSVINDQPRFSYRGFMLDVSRHFLSVEEVLEIIDIMAMMKLNRFHFHLTDDQGWRIVIDSYPKLTEVGSIRKETWSKGKCNHTPIKGYYTKTEIRRIVAYCNERYIKIIPEIDFPGHIRSAIAAYPSLSCTEEQLEVDTHFGISEHILCAGKESTYTFLRNVFMEVIDLFDPEYIHIGGDEVPKAKWRKCPHCQQKIKEQGLNNEEDLQGFMMNELGRFIESMGIKVVGWNDMVKSDNIRDTFIIQHWLGTAKLDRNLQEEMTEKAREVIISDYFHYYLDQPYSITNLKTAYCYEPVPKEMKSHHNILGVEAALWTENIRNRKELYNMLLPRLWAVAETAWTEQENKDFSSFKESVERLSIYYRERGVYINHLRDVSWKPSHIPGYIYKILSRLITRYETLLRIKEILYRKLGVS